MSSLFSNHPAPPQDIGSARLVRVAVHRGIDKARTSHDSLLTYRLADDAPPVVAGQLVSVPLGKANTAVGAVVVEAGDGILLGDLPLHKVKVVSAVTPAVLPTRLLELAKWMSAYYVCPLGMTLQTVLPAAVRKQIGAKRVLWVRPAPLAGDAKLPKMSKALAAAFERVQYIANSRFPMPVKALLAALADKPSITPASVKRLIALELLLTEARDEVAARAPNLPELEQRLPGAAPPASLRLTADQAVAVAGISRTLGTFAPHLVLGITGSGKTEVYLRVIQDLLSRDETTGAIVLVPEIALTPQTAGRFVQRFGSTVAVLHSGLTSAQRNAQWSLVAQGAVRVVVGARSALFAPLAKIGLIIVDEEHDSSYKQDQLPRYHARDAAIKRAQLESCPVVLGSATPSLESWANASGEKPKYALWRLPTRATGAKMPKVEIVDLTKERALRAQLDPQGWRDRQLHLLGPTLQTAIEQALNARGQVLLLLNRRGYANYLCCPDARCGWVMRCDHCDATSVYHLHTLAAARTPGFVRCHHCLAELLLPRKCPVCAKSVNTFGLGTQRVEEELQRKFHHTHGLTLGTTMLRVDSDTMKSSRDYFDALQRFSTGEVRLLLGTQMIAKGLDFPNVRLVGVVNADTSLNMPDFRSAERTFQLVAQVAGRAGRADLPGRVIVQTMSPNEPSIVLAAKHDFESFALRELDTRKRSGLPPTTRMARIVCRDLELSKATASASRLAALLREQQRTHTTLVIRGPMPCAISRIADHHRIAIELLAPTRGTLQSVLGSLRNAGELTSDSHTAIDVDPISLL